MVSLSVAQAGRASEPEFMGVDPINPGEDIVEHPEPLQEEEFRSLLKTAGLTPLYVLVSSP